MNRNNILEKIIIIDFGSQFTQLIARKVREADSQIDIQELYTNNTTRF